MNEHVKLCTDCRWFSFFLVEDEGGYAYNNAHENSFCAYPLSLSKVNGQPYKLCRHERDNGSCGPNAIFFEENPEE